MQIDTDPTGYFANTIGDEVKTLSGYTMPLSQWCIQIAGYIPEWIVSEPDVERPLMDIFKECYLFGLFEISGCNVNEMGIFSYPGDPDLHPTLKITRPNEILYGYEHAIFAVVDRKTNDFKVVRMD